ncbi:MAG: OmpA family protein [Ferruginibacter sp.]
MKRLSLFTFLFILSNLSFSQTGITLSLNFEFNKYNISSENAKRLDSLADKIKNIAIDSIHLNGYCDSKGSDEYNDKLSVQRARSVKDYLGTRLQKKNVAFIDKGFGKRNLLTDESTEAEQALNRRVDILISPIAEPKPSEAQQPDTSRPITPKSLSAAIEDTLTKVGTKLTLRNLNFYGGTPNLLPTSVPALQELLTVMQQNPKLRISIEGHICCFAFSISETATYSLSTERAKTIWKYLIQMGISESRLTYKGFGVTRPIYPLPEKTEEERIANRRVEIRIIEK